MRSSVARWARQHNVILRVVFLARGVDILTDPRRGAGFIFKANMLFPILVLVEVPIAMEPEKKSACN